MSIGVNSKIVIAGGGIAGLFAARYLVHLGYKNITLIEAEKSLGGLLKQDQYSDKITKCGKQVFDRGTHFILKTGNPKIDAILDLDLPNSDYIKFENSLHEGQYINSQIYAESGCINTTSFERHIQQSIYNEMSLLKGTKQAKAENLAEHLKSKYGQTAYSEILSPIYEKFAGSSADQLDVSVENTFFPSRLILGDREEMKALKQQAFWDDRAAFASFQDSTSPIHKYYPREGTLQVWLDSIISSLKAGGVNILLNTKIKSTEINGEQIRSLSLEDGTRLECDYLFWTVPPIFLAHSTGVKIPSKKPSMRSVSVIHFVADRKPLDGPFWLNIFAPELSSYRVTVYDNFSPMKLNKGHRISVEILHKGDFENTDQSQDKIFQELLQMGILPSDANCLWSTCEEVLNGFPIMQPGDMALYMQQVDMLSWMFSNVHIVSRFQGGHSGQMAIINNVFGAINALTSPTQHGISKLAS